MLDILYYLIASLGINLLMFIPAYILKADKLTDLSYSLTFAVLTLIALISNGFSLENIIVSSMVFAWSLRLGSYLFNRIKKIKRDKRFDGIRESFTSFLKFWILQGVSVWIILIPALLFMDNQSKRIDIILIVGFVVWLIGILIETIADKQKYDFIQKQENKGKFIQSGLWKYSRHPNYFGEILCWIGVYIATIPSLALWERAIGLVSPLFISTLIIFVTGIPPLEKSADAKWGKDRKYRNYKQRTSILVPLPIKKKDKHSN